jgi:DNA polymerase III subunit delta'
MANMATGKWPIIGHEWAVDLLHTAVVHQRIGHAYLITGQAQVGKATLARVFAQALNCEAEAVETRPCGICRPCQLIAAGRHPDVRHVVPEVSERGKASLKIDQIRALQKELNLGTMEARYKIGILEQFEAANPNAANAFLKTLEEPPSKVILILTAAEADALLPTIASRCRTLPLRPLPTAVIARALQEQWHVQQERAELLAHVANGRLGWAVQAVGDTAVWQSREEQLELLQTILTSKRVGRFQLAEKLANKAEILPIWLDMWLSWWRDVLIWQQGGGRDTAVVINIDYLPSLRQYADQWSLSQIQKSLHQTQTALWQLERNANTRLVLENLFLTYPKI